MSGDEKARGNDLLGICKHGNAQRVKMCYTSRHEKVYAVFPTKDMRGDLAMDQLRLNGSSVCSLTLRLTSTSRTRRIRTALTTLWTTRSCGQHPRGAGGRAVPPSGTRRRRSGGRVPRRPARGERDRRRAQVRQRARVGQRGSQGYEEVIPRPSIHFANSSRKRRLDAASTCAKSEVPWLSIATTQRKSFTSNSQHASAAPNSSRK